MDTVAAPLTQYRRRFLYLFVVIALNISNAMCWISFAPITFQTNSYYNNAFAATFFNVVFMALSVPAGLVAAWQCDKYGLRGGVRIGGFFNLVGNVIRFIGSLPSIPLQWRFTIAFTGQILASIAQPFIMYLPTKLTAFWFPQNQRVLANTLASMSNPLGIALMYSLSPAIVNDQAPENFPMLTGLTAVLGVIAAVLSLTVTSSEPPNPVSASKSNNVRPPPFLVGVRKVLQSRNFLLLSVCLGGGVGLFNTLYNNLQPALCSKGYSPGFTSSMGTLLILAGLAGAAVAGALADATKKHELILKVSFMLAAMAACSLAASIDYTEVELWIGGSIAAFGFFGFAVYPLGLETGVEVTYPVAEATSTGLIIIIGQLQGVLYVILTTLATTTVSAEDLARQTCSKRTSEITNVKSWQYSFLLWAAFVTTVVIICTIFFRPKFRRRMADEIASISANAETTQFVREEPEE